MIRSLMRKILLVGTVFLLSYVINLILIFSDNPMPFGEHTPFIVTAIAFFLGLIILFFGGGGDKQT